MTAGWLPLAAVVVLLLVVVGLLAALRDMRGQRDYYRADAQWQRRIAEASQCRVQELERCVARTQELPVVGSGWAGDGDVYSEHLLRDAEEAADAIGRSWWGVPDVEAEVTKLYRDIAKWESRRG